MRLELSEVSFSYNDRTIVSNLNLSVDSGESVALVGPSGSGKSTVLSLIGGLLAPSNGSVRIAAASPTSSSTELSVGWVFQTNTILPHRTVLDNAALSALATGARRSLAHHLAKRALASVGLESLADRKASTLSGGEVQRLTIARAMSNQPDLILADEPTGQLDSVTSQSVARYLLSNGDLAGIVILATHDLELAEKCSLVLHMESL